MRRKARTPVGDAARRWGRARQCLAPTVAFRGTGVCTVETGMA